MKQEKNLDAEKTAMTKDATDRKKTAGIKNITGCEGTAVKMTEGLKAFIAGSVSPFHTVAAVKERLLEKQFTEISLTEDFSLQAGGRYFVSLYDSSLAAFTIGDRIKPDRIDHGSACLRLVSSHTDFPAFKLKPDCMIYAGNKSGTGYLKLNTEVYGGPILNTWMDRPLAVAGRLLVRGKDAFLPQSILVDTKRPVLVIPNLAIHMNRDVNKGVELNRQKDMLPITALVDSKIWKPAEKQAAVPNEAQETMKDVVLLFFGEVLQEMEIAREEILDYELYLYNCEEGCVVGVDSQMYSSPRLDNLVSVYAQTEAIIKAERQDGVNLALYFDNEEIGSKTKQGAASFLVPLLLEKIYAGLRRERSRMINDILSGVMLSVDVAHAVHPNVPEKSDITNQVMLNGGIVLKIAASQSYANDGVGTAMVRAICKEQAIPCQSFVNRSDLAGGQTLGAISSTVLPMRTMDVGIPLLAMHSARELMGVEDEKNLEKFLTVFYS